MKIYARPRQAGKTTELIKLAAAEFLYIVCTDREQARYVASMARKMGLDIPFPVTWAEFANRSYHARGINGFVIDNLDMCIQGMSTVPVKAVSLTAAPGEPASGAREWGPEDVRPNDRGGYDLSDDAAAEVIRASFGESGDE